MNRQGPAAQSLRGLSGFPGQQAQNRNPPLGAARLQNGKMGAASQWAFGAQGAAPGLSGPQGRAPGGPTNFAQTLGGSQSAASLDPSEFPSLSGSQPQYQNSGQAVWSAQRTGQHTPVQRGQPSGSEHAQHALDEAFFSSSSLGGAMDEFRHSGQSVVGQLSSSSQPQPSSIDDFPPLNRTGHGDIGQDSRINMMQSVASGGFASASGFGPGSSRAPGEALRQGQDKNAGSRGLQIGGNESSLFSAQYSSDVGGDSPAEHNRPKSPSKMTQVEQWGIPGLLETIRSGNADKAAMVMGHDLTLLGLDLNSSDPLWPSFGSPFAQFPARPLPPDYTLPACYNVTNTHSVVEKIPGLSDESLFYIFYDAPKDAEQEYAAMELTNRNWRFHKGMGLWITKESAFGEPKQISPEAEAGRYIVFNIKTWSREGREMMLRYSDLDDHHQSMNGSLLS